MKSILFIALLLFILPTDIVVAQGGFITCDGTDCSACNFVELLNLLIQWLLGIVFVVFAVIMTVAGFGLVTSGGNQSALDAAKSKFTNAVIGIIIILAAWIIVDTLLRGTLAGGGVIAGWGPWAEVQCQVQAPAQPWSRSGRDAVSPSIITAPASSTPSGTASHAAAVAALGGGFVVSSSGNCSDRNNRSCTSLDGVRDLTITRVRELQTAVGVPLVVTGGTEVGHAAGQYSHANGYKIDLRPTPQLNSHIENNYTSVGGSRWRDSRGNVYYRHGPPDHWDITVTN